LTHTAGSRTLCRMGTGGAIRVIVGVALLIVALALLGLTLPHDPDPGQSWTPYPSYWSGY
jgi:uridine phosphorylase